MNLEEKNYLNLLDSVLKTGSVREDRTGVGTIGLFGTQLRFNLENNIVPMLTTKKMFTKAIIEELLFFIRGETNTKLLEDKGVNIWKGNTSREFLDKKGLQYLPEGDMGKGYGYQWRKFGEHDNGDSICKNGIDQLQQVFDTIKNNPNDRRMIISAWNPQQLPEMALPPCHLLFQFYVDNGYLSCQWYQRSVDMFLGLPFNILSYAILTRIMAQATGLKAKEVIFTGGDTHIYSNHADQVKEQISREPYNFPTMQINKNISSIQDIEKLSFEDFVIDNYQHHPAIKAPMAI